MRTTWHLDPSNRLNTIDMHIRGCTTMRYMRYVLLTYLHGPKIAAPVF